MAVQELGSLVSKDWGTAESRWKSSASESKTHAVMATCSERLCGLKGVVTHRGPWPRGIDHGTPWCEKDGKANICLIWEKKIKTRLAERECQLPHRQVVMLMQLPDVSRFIGPEPMSGWGGGVPLRREPVVLPQVYKVYNTDIVPRFLLQGAFGHLSQRKGTTRALSELSDTRSGPVKQLGNSKAVALAVRVGTYGGQRWVKSLPEKVSQWRKRWSFE